MPREGHLAAARNMCLKEIARLGRTNYVINIDMDIVGWDLHGVADSFSRTDLKWDVMCAHGIAFYGNFRDTYAFRVGELDTNLHWTDRDREMSSISEQQHKQLEEKFVSDVTAVRSMMDFPKGDLIRVHSCFGGLAIYR
jgi:hypothetical protein